MLVLFRVRKHVSAGRYHHYSGSFMQDRHRALRRGCCGGRQTLRAVSHKDDLPVKNFIVNLNETGE
jgi:hypothetical protein